MTILYSIWPESPKSISISIFDKALCVSHRYNTVCLKYTAPAQNHYCVLGVFKFGFDKDVIFWNKLGCGIWHGRDMFIINISHCY